MSILFYDHLVDKQEILVYIDNLEAEDQHKGKLKQLVDDILHQGIVEYVLQKLHPHQHHHFLSSLHSAPYDPELINFLKEHIGEDIEDMLRNHAGRLIVTIKKDLGVS